MKVTFHQFEQFSLGAVCLGREEFYPFFSVNGRAGFVQ